MYLPVRSQVKTFADAEPLIYWDDDLAVIFKG